MFNLAATVATVDSIKFTWAPGSSLTAAYLIYVKRVTNTRDYSTSNFTLLANTTSTTYLASGLASGSFYTFLVNAVTAAGEVNNQVQFTFQTQAAAGQGQLPEGCTCQGDIGEKRREGTPAHALLCFFLCFAAVPVSAGLLGGIAAAVILVIVGLIVGFVLYRRNTLKKQKVLLDEYSQQLQMVGGRERTQGKGTREHRERAPGNTGKGHRNKGKGLR